MIIIFHSLSLDVPFISGQYNHGNNAFFRLATNYVYYDNSISLIFINIHLVSSSLANQINSHLFTLPTNPTCGVPLVIENEDDCEKIYESGWSSITVKDDYCNSLTGNLIISDNNCLQYILLQSDVLSNIQSVEISNLTNLSLIRTDYSFYYTTSLTLSSTLYIMTIN